MWTQCDGLLFSWAPKSLQVVIAAMKLKTLVSWKKSYDKTRQHIEKQRHYFGNKVLSSQSYGFSSSHVWMWELDHKESWALKNWCLWTVVLGKTLVSLLDCEVINPVNPKGNQSWIFIRRTDPEAEAPILWPPDAKNWLFRKTQLFRKTLMLGKIEGERIRGWQRMRCLDGTTDSMDVSLRQLQELGWTGKPGVLQSMGSQKVGRNWAIELSWTEPTHLSMQGAAAAVAAG